MQIWLNGCNDPAALAEKVNTDTTFRENFVRYLNASISNSFPVLPIHEDVDTENAVDVPVDSSNRDKEPDNQQEPAQSGNVNTTTTLEKLVGISSAVDKPPATDAANPREKGDGRSDEPDDDDSPPACFCPGGDPLHKANKYSFDGKQKHEENILHNCTNLHTRYRELKAARCHISSLRPPVAARPPPPYRNLPPGTPDPATEDPGEFPPHDGALCPLAEACEECIRWRTLEIVDEALLILECNVHNKPKQRHNACCTKGKKAGCICRFGFEKLLEDTTHLVEGILFLARHHGWVIAHNRPTLRACRCNHELRWLHAGADSKCSAFSHRILFLQKLNDG
jgi:hypothetical protein